MPPLSILLDSITVFLRKKGDLGDMEGKLEMSFYFWVLKSFPPYSHIFLVTISKTIIHLLSV